MRKICNICGLPESDKGTEIDIFTGKLKKEVSCVGHIGIHPYLWNLHPKYEIFKFYKNKR